MFTVKKSKGFYLKNLNFLLKEFVATDDVQNVMGHNPVLEFLYSYTLNMTES